MPIVFEGVSGIYATEKLLWSCYIHNSSILVYLNNDLNCFQSFQAVLILYYYSFETQMRPRSHRGSRQVQYYVSHEQSASLKIQHKDFGKIFS